ncbi:glycerol-3-phosphate acyltransferase, partial [Mesorhizobium sp. M0222]
RAQEARSTPSRMTSFMIAHFAELDAHNLSWPVGLGAATAFAVVLAVSRIVSLSSMLAALTAIALVGGMEQPLPYRLLVIAGGIYVIVRHRANIARLMSGAEPRL